MWQKKATHRLLYNHFFFASIQALHVWAKTKLICSSSSNPSKYNHNETWATYFFLRSRDLWTFSTIQGPVESCKLEHRSSPIVQQPTTQHELPSADTVPSSESLLPLVTSACLKNFQLKFIHPRAGSYSNEICACQAIFIFQHTQWTRGWFSANSTTKIHLGQWRLPSRSGKCPEFSPKAPD